MPEGRRWSPENPSPAMKSFAEFIRNKGYSDGADLETTVAATFVFHREWQSGHAAELVKEREEGKAAREAEKAQKAQEREAKKAERDKAKAEKEAEKEAKKAQRDAEKAEKAARAEQEGADGDDSDSTTESNGEPRRRLRLKKDNVVAEEATAGASAGSF
jgi:hypothetical protein